MTSHAVLTASPIPLMTDWKVSPIAAMSSPDMKSLNAENALPKVSVRGDRSVFTTKSATLPMNPERTGIRSDASPFFIPEKDVFMSCSASWNAAASFTAASSMTPPSSCTRSIIPCVSSADVLNSAPISIAPRPSSSVARAVLSVPSSMPWRPLTTLANSSSVDIFDTSSMLRPIAWNAAT